MSKKKDIVLAVAGLALFVFASRRIGWSAVIRAIVEARIGVAIIVALTLGRLFLQTRSWSIALNAEGINVSPIRLILIRLASQGMGYLSVLGPVASEPMKISLLQSAKGADGGAANPGRGRLSAVPFSAEVVSKPGGSATTATLVDTGVYWFSSGIVAIVGCLSAALLLIHGRHSIGPLSLLGVILAGSLYLLVRPKSALSPLVDALGTRCPRWLEKGKQIEIALREFEIRYPSSIRRMLLLGAICQILLTAEVVAVFWCLKIPLHAGTVLAVEGASRAIKIMAGWMPARIGADESGIAGAFFAFGLSPVSGLTLALARRSRDLLVALIGLTWLALSAGFFNAQRRMRTTKRQTNSAAAYWKEKETTCKLC